ncbi:MAG TPA: dihydrofolate reductase family protein [Armatimonadota bacterium]
MKLPEVILYIACSLDGYIATAAHGLDWLTRFETPEEDYGYQAFYQSVDALLLGSGTYEQMPKLGPWPYAGKPCWVFSRRRLHIEQPDVTLTDQDPETVLQEIVQRGLKRAWLVGGGKLIASFRARALITEYIISIIPVILGAGIPLFVPPGPVETLRSIETRTYASGLVQLHHRPVG